MGRRPPILHVFEKKVKNIRKFCRDKERDNAEKSMGKRGKFFKKELRISPLYWREIYFIIESSKKGKNKPRFENRSTKKAAISEKFALYLLEKQR